MDFVYSHSYRSFLRPEGAKMIGKKESTMLSFVLSLSKGRL
jgi:hypothetical protein